MVMQMPSPDVHAWEIQILWLESLEQFQTQRSMECAQAGPDIPKVITVTLSGYKPSGGWFHKELRKVLQSIIYKSTTWSRNQACARMAGSGRWKPTWEEIAPHSPATQVDSETMKCHNALLAAFVIKRNPQRSSWSRCLRALCWASFVGIFRETCDSLISFGDSFWHHWRHRHSMKASHVREK